MTNSTLGGEEATEFAWQKQCFTADVLGSPFAKTVLKYGDKVSNTPVSMKALIQGATGDNQTASQQRTMLCALDGVQCGDYLYFDSTWWLAFGMADDNLVYTKVVLQYCQESVSFEIPGTSTAVSYPVVVARRNGETEDVQSLVTSGKDVRVLYLPYNSDTIKVDNGFRLLLDRNSTNPTCWKVKGVDAESLHLGGYGVIRWDLEEDLLEEADDVTNRLADNTEFNELHSTEERSKAGDWGL